MRYSLWPRRLPAGRPTESWRRYKLFAGKFHDYLSVTRRRNKTIVLLCSDARHWLEPVGKMRRALFDRPILHGVRHHTRYIGFQRPAFRHGLSQRLICLLRQPFPHHTVIKDQASEYLRYAAQARSILSNNFSLHFSGSNTPEKVNRGIRPRGVSEMKRGAQILYFIVRNCYNVSKHL